MPESEFKPLILPLGDRGLLVRFDDTLSEPGNRAAIAFGSRVASARLPGVEEVVPNLVSVLLRYDPAVIGYDTLAGEVRLVVSAPDADERPPARHRVGVRFDGEDLAELAASLGLAVSEFIAEHSATPLRVLASGFAPGFVYCGFHSKAMRVPRRRAVRPLVPAGTVLFAAGQTAITSTPIPTGWHVIGHTAFRNFNPVAPTPTTLEAGDEVMFEVEA